MILYLSVYHAGITKNCLFDSSPLTTHCELNKPDPWCSLSLVTFVPQFNSRSKNEPKGLSSRPLKHYSTWRCIIRSTSSEPSPIDTPLYDTSRLEAVQIWPSYVMFLLVLFTRGMFCLLLTDSKVLLVLAAYPVVLQPSRQIQ
jgi:hypothetical protein